MSAARRLVRMTAPAGVLVLFLGAMPGAACAQALPQPPDIVAKPAYIALVRAMQLDETLLASARQKIETETHRFKPECFANLRPALVTETIAWALEPDLTEKEVADSLAKSTFEKARVLAGQRRVTLSVRAEVLDLLNTCTDTLEGTRQITYCQSPWVPSEDKVCTTRYEVTGVAGDAARITRVSLYCDLPKAALSSIITEWPGRHETIGLRWVDNRTLEVLTPLAAVPRYVANQERAGGLKYEYRPRKPDDPPPLACIATPPIDEFGWPVR